MFINGVTSNTCQDLDTTACVLLHKQKPDLCSEPTLAGVCQRFCGSCRKILLFFTFHIKIMDAPSKGVIVKIVLPPF